MTLEVGARSRIGSGAPSGGAAVLRRSTPYPWPYDQAFTARRCALLVLDTADPSPSPADPAWPAVVNLANAVATAGGTVVEIHNHRPPRRGEITTNTATPARLVDADYHIDAPGWDAFYGTALDQLLRATHRDLLLLTGAFLEVAVHSTMRSANDRGYECVLIADGCVAGTESTRAAARSSIEMSGGIFGAVTDHTDLLSLLARCPK